MMNNQINHVPEDLAQELQAALDQTAEDVGLFDLGVSVGVVTPDGQWTGASGISNLETLEATQTEDLFNIGSISKSYTSAVILKLQEQGKLSLDDTIDKWLPEIAANITNGDDLTIRQLLNGTGGLWDYENNEEFEIDLLTDYLSGSNRDWQPEDLIAYAFDQPLFSGELSSEQWTYTNTGNVIAALIAEEATGKPFKQILAEEILQPLRLNNTFFTTEDADLEQRARGYGDRFTTADNLGKDGVLEDYSSVDTKIYYGPGSIVSSAEDVAIFFNSLASGDLLQPESTGEIFNYVNTGRPEAVAQFGLGVVPNNYPWGETRSMGGVLDGYISEVDYFPSSDTTISVLVNQSSFKSEFLGLVHSAFKASIANTLGLGDAFSIQGTSGDDYLPGTAENDAIYGIAGNDIILGKNGSDVLNGGLGQDFLQGGQGNDWLFGQEAKDILDGDRGDDFLNGGNNSDRILGGKGKDSLLGGRGKDSLDGGKNDDTLDGGAGNDLVKDTQGNNVLYGNRGDDLLFSGKGNDILYGDPGKDRLISGAGYDLLLGGKGDDYLDGGTDDDSLVGNAGRDTLTGGAGSDTLSGGDGSDRFMLSFEGTDSIDDFEDGQDLLKLPEAIYFTDVQIIQGQGENAVDTLINFQSETLAILSNLDSEEISHSDFVLI